MDCDIPAQQLPAGASELCFGVDPSPQAWLPLLQDPLLSSWAPSLALSHLQKLCFRRSKPSAAVFLGPFIFLDWDSSSPFYLANSCSLLRPNLYFTFASSSLTLRPRQAFGMSLWAPSTH